MEKTLFTVAPLLRRSIVLHPFISQKTVGMTFLTECCARNFFFTGDSICYLTEGLNIVL